jgi:hypothetical protein
VCSQLVRTEQVVVPHSQTFGDWTVVKVFQPMPHDHPKSFRQRTFAEEKVWRNRKRNYFFIQRGIERAPRGSRVQITQCNQAVYTSKYGTLKVAPLLGLQKFGSSQMIAYSYDPDDLLMFAIEHEYWIDSPEFDAMLELVKEGEDD